VVHGIGKNQECDPLSNISLATLLKIVVPTPGNPSVIATTLRYQNYQSADYAFNSELYSYAGFQVQSYADADLSLGGGDCQIAIQNSQIVRGLLEQYNDLKRSIATLYHVQPSTTKPAIMQRLIISHATPEGGLVLFSARSPTSALQGPLATRYLTARDFQELPRYRMQA
jgi:hypothetical protein